MAASVGVVRPNQRLQIAPIKNRAAQAVQASGQASAARTPALAAANNPRNGSRIRRRGKLGFRVSDTKLYNVIKLSIQHYLLVCIPGRDRTNWQHPVRARNPDRRG